MTKGKIYLLGILSGLLLMLSFPPYPFYMFAFIGFVPLLLALEEKQFKKPYLLIYLTFFIYHGGTSWWISSWQKNSDPFLLASGLIFWAVHPFFFMIPFAFYNSIRKKIKSKNAIWIFPFAWVMFEWLHSLTDLSYPWITFGYSQIHNYYWVQFADICGVWGISFVIAIINVLVFKFILELRENKNQDLSLGKILSAKNSVIRFVILALLIIVPIIYGVIRVKIIEFNRIFNTSYITAGIIQPNINPWEKWQGGVLEQIRKHQKLTDSLRKSVGRLDLVVWSETAIPFMNLDFNARHNLNIIQKWCDSSNISLLTGFTDIVIYSPRQSAPKTARFLYKDTNLPYEAFNSAILLNPTKENLINKTYHKMKLTPFSEHLPFEEQLQFAKNWIEWGVGISSWAKGREQFPLVVKNNGKEIKIGTIICIESIYPGFVSNLSNLDADIFVIITNDAWYDHTFGPAQHYDIAAMRAVENRKYIIRCANSGVSGFIDNTGKTILKAELYKDTAIAASIPGTTGKTIYAQIGDILPIGCTAITLLAFLFALGMVINKRKK